MTPPESELPGPLGVVKDAAAERIEGERPGRLRALAAAAIAGVAAAVITYKLLRSEPENKDQSQSREGRRRPATRSARREHASRKRQRRPSPDARSERSGAKPGTDPARRRRAQSRGATRPSRGPAAKRRRR